MGLQLVVQASSDKVVSSNLGEEISEWAEIFHIEGEHWGLSIPTKVIDDFGENNILSRLRRLHYYSLNEGKWEYA